MDNDKRPVKESLDLILSIKLPIFERHINLIFLLFDKFILDTIELTHIFKYGSKYSLLLLSCIFEFSFKIGQFSHGEFLVFKVL
ncbi:hypothetical protein CNEONATNEC26_01863 [Clostridium neonatale]|nr:hypothetical protein CNEONATNEC26_01863 [Clostridium neonatale]